MQALERALQRAPQGGLVVNDQNAWTQEATWWSGVK
jgi:hypothetical protein